MTTVAQTRFPNNKTTPKLKQIKNFGSSLMISCNMKNIPQAVEKIRFDGNQPQSFCLRASRK